MLYIPIWLYSNKKGICWNADIDTLHSNLVIFKLFASESASNSFVTFTFQSGYIQIMLPSCLVIRLYPLHSNLVIFKYGDIGLWLLDNALYIPIWLYSNMLSLVSVYHFTQLYIPIWLYSNYHKLINLRDTKRLYIPIWLYSNKDIGQSWRMAKTPLHSNLVIFKWQLG